jgi:hypothetical protein
MIGMRERELVDDEEERAVASGADGCEDLRAAG